MKDKRTVTISDDTGVSVQATFWGEIAHTNIAEGTIVAIKGAKVSDYGGKSLNLGNDHSVIEMEPEHEARYQ